MLLKSEMDGWTIEYGTGEAIGRFRDLIVDTRKPRWPVRALLLSRGIARRTHLFDVPTREIKVDRHNRTMVRHGHAPLRQEAAGASALDRLRLGSLAGAQVFSSDNEPIGKAYDFVIATSPPEGWLVWRLLVKVPGARSRRLRLPIGDIASIGRDGIVLRASKEEIRASN